MKRLGVTILVVIAGGAAHAGPIGYYVATFANNSSATFGYQGSATASYNSPGLGANFVTNGTGAGGTGVTDTTGVLFSAFDSTGVSLPAVQFGTCAPPCTPTILPPAGGGAYASANLTNGEIHAYENTTGADSSGIATGAFNDTLFFLGNNSNSLLYITATLDGGQGAGGPNSISTANATWTLSVNQDASLTISIVDNFPSVTDINGNPCIGSCISQETVGGSGWQSFGFGTNSANNIIFNGVYSLGTLPYAVITDSLALSSGGGDGNPVFPSPSSNDFSNTSTLNVSLSPGVSYTSASGVFLTQVSSAPEPGTFALIGSALIGLAGFLRRRNSKLQR